MDEAVYSSLSDEEIMTLLTAYGKRLSGLSSWGWGTGTREDARHYIGKINLLMAELESRECIGF